MEKMTIILGFKQKVSGKSILVRETSGAKVLRWLSFGVLTKEKAIGKSEKKGVIRRQSTGFTPIFKTLDSSLNVMESSLSRAGTLANPCYLPIWLSAQSVCLPAPQTSLPPSTHPSNLFIICLSAGWL